MSKLLSILVLASAAVLAAQQPAAKLKEVPVKPTSPASGAQMFAAYCATCHGANAKGGGPAASALKIPPADLTLLSKKNGGVFPANHVSTVLQFGTENPAAHGSATMPMWGTLLRSLNEGSQDPGPIVQQRVANLTNYIKTIQQ
jgi:mono/diheme cytochrome c family protein